MVTGAVVLSLGREGRRTSRPGRLRRGGGVCGWLVLGRDHAADEVGPQGDDLSDLLRHQVQDGVALGRIEVAQLRMEFGGALRQCGGHLQESLRRNH